VDLASCEPALEPSHDTDPEEIAGGAGVVESAWVACARSIRTASVWKSGYTRQRRRPADEHPPTGRLSVFYGITWPSTDDGRVNASACAVSAGWSAESAEVRSRGDRVGGVIGGSSTSGGGDEACVASVDLASCEAALKPSHDADPEEIADGVGVAENAWVACDRQAVPAEA
jgi:hypothetical protein